MFGAPTVVLVKKERKRMSDNNIVVAVYNAHTEAEQAVKELQSPGSI